MRCLEKKPADRWQRAAEVHQALETMATPSGGTAPTPARPAVTRRFPRGAQRAIAAVVALVALAVAVLAAGVLALARPNVFTIAAAVIIYTNAAGVAVQYHGTPLIVGMAALGTVAILPVAILVFILHRHIVRGLSLGAVKG